MTEVRVATGHDVSQIVDVHKAAFPEFFLTFLGQAFLTRFYAAVVDDTACLSLVADDGSSILGFVVGPLHPAGFFRGLLLHQGLGFATDAVPQSPNAPCTLRVTCFAGCSIGATHRMQGPKQPC